jgi:hypothetical protein
MKLNRTLFYLPNGVLAASWTAVQVGQRIKVEP